MNKYQRLDRKELDAQYFIRGIVPEWDHEIEEFSAKSQTRRAKGHCWLNISYGDHVRQALDVFKPENLKIEAVPVLIFFHGGYWRMLDKLNFSHVASAGDYLGAITVIVNYRLLPEFGLSDIVSDCCTATRWVLENISNYKGDPEKVILSGHSAGAQLGAQVSARINVPLKGFIGISGVYDLRPIQNCFLNDIQFLDTSLVKKFSAESSVSSLPCPAHFFYGAREPSEFERQSENQANFWERPGSSSILSKLDNENHASILKQLVTPESAVLKSLISFWEVG